MSQVFSHGRLRLYLLKLLDEGAKHGYELIRLLEDHFMGLYAPSPGTIYPRLQRMEADGLVTHTLKDGRKKVYQITDAGRDELRRRQDELAALEADIHESVHGLAEEIRENVRDSASNLQVELTQAAREMRQQQRHLNRQRLGKLVDLGSLGDNLGRLGGDLGHLGSSLSSNLSGTNLMDALANLTGARQPPRPGEPQQRPATGDPGRGLERRLIELLTVVRQVAQRSTLTEAQLRECRAILDDALDRLKETLRRQD